jgi:hypothetical protein
MPPATRLALTVEADRVLKPADGVGFYRSVQRANIWTPNALGTIVAVRVEIEWGE